MELDEYVKLAMQGNKNALEKVVAGIQDNIYGLSIKMLYNPADADDATQEILIRVITNLNSFSGKSKFTTWVYRIAANYLIRFKQAGKKYSTTFLKYEEGLELDSASAWKGEESEMKCEHLNEMRASCLQGLLMCLSRELRIVYLLVDIFDVTSAEGAKILGITSELFRKRLSRGREKLKTFMFKNCGLVNKANPCKCGYHVAEALNTGRFTGENVLFANLPQKNQETETSLIEEMDELNMVGHLFKTNPLVKAPDKYLSGIKEIINSGKYKYFNN